MQIQYFVPLLLVLINLLPQCQTPQTHTPKPAVLIGYVYGNSYEIDGLDIPAEKLTHINYAFANIIDGKVAEGHPNDRRNLAALRRLKKRNPDLNILVSVGGWGWSGGFSDAVLTDSSRQVFANSIVHFIQRFQLDGIDLDWEYPNQPGAGNIHRPEDKQNFTAALKVIREKLDSLGAGQKHYFLTIATAASQRYLDNTEMDQAQKYLDFINIMTYDFRGSWDPHTGHHASLLPSALDTGKFARGSAVAVEEHLRAGIPAEKLVMGVPFYGRWWTNVRPENNGLFQPSTGKRGSHRYYLLADSLIDRNGYQRHFDTTALAPYLWHPDSMIFITYEDTISLDHKMKFLRDQGLAGFMFWEYKGDDGTLVDFLWRELQKR